MVRLHGVSEQNIHPWKTRCGGMSVNEAKHQRELEKEKSRLKGLLSEAGLGLGGLHGRVVKKVAAPTAGR